MRWRAAQAGGAALLLVLLVSGLAWASLVRPLREVAKAQRRLRQAEEKVEAVSGGWRLKK